MDHPSAPLHFDEHGAGPPAVFVHGTFSWGSDSFPDQVPLGVEARLLLVDRVGFGATPGGPSLGWTVDAPAVVALLRSVGPAHLIGHSYGAVVSLLVAAAAPGLVRSLVVIEPTLFELAVKSAAARAVLAALRPVHEAAPAMTARDFWIERRVAMGAPRTSVEAGLDKLTEADWRSVEASRREAWPGDAPIDLGAVRSAPFPKVMVVGTAPVAEELETTRQAFRDVAAIVAEGSGASLVRFEASTHSPQLTEPDRFNALLRTVWRDA